MPSDPESATNGGVTIVNPPDWKASVASWLFGQPAIVVLLFTGIGMVGWVVYYCLTTGIPNHDAAVARMISEKDSEHRTERKEERSEYLSSLKEIISAIGGRIDALEERIQKSDVRHDEWFRHITGAKPFAQAAAPKDKAEEPPQ
jgi:hypothetical protein